MVNQLSNRKMLKWLGGKSPIVDKVKDLIQHDKGRWVDLFCGGCSLPLELDREKVWVNDINFDLTVFLDWVKYDGIIPDSFPLINDSETYYKYRDLYNLDRDEYYAPYLLYYLNQTCVNGIMRYNSSGEFNTPWGGKGRNINYTRNFSQYQAKMQNWKITAYDYKNIIGDLIPGDILFLDPPYDTFDGKGFTNYFGKFDWNNQVELANLAAKHDTVIACNSATVRIIDLYKSLGFETELISMPRKVATNGNRSNVLEMFATKGFE
jgi:DNA adenine methylase